MKFARIGPRGQERPAVLDAAGDYRDISSLATDIGPELLAAPDALMRGVSLASLPVLPASSRIGAPVAQVGKFICVGLNYRDHAKESKMAVPAEPVLFLKATSAICGPNDPLLMPRNGLKLDWEVELGLVIGRPCGYVDEREAMSYVAGAVLANDVSERAFQLERSGQWDKGKGCDSFGPVGPWLVTLDSVGDLSDLKLWCAVNGRRMQDASTRDMIFNCAYLIHYISQFMSLQPGDIIATGTPPGVGMGMQPPVWMKPSDVLSCGIDGLGEQRQVVAPPI
jgi:2,4-didehydro-3-deoxy-L-rhamnonate hydrolase